MTQQPAAESDYRDRHVVILGGAGFLGSNLGHRLLGAGARVTCVDNLITGNRANLDALAVSERFSVVEHDITRHIEIGDEIDFVFNFASPASPADYLNYPIETLMVGAHGTHNALELARAKGANFLLASTSEVYGDPQVNPQPESYWGHVNPIGPRGVYDEAKRYAEAISLAYHREHRLQVRIARIFNTYGPRMRLRDGRAVPAFFMSAMRGEPLPVHGDGSQTRSLCFIDDMVDGLLRLAVSDYTGPVNLGNPQEVTVLALAQMIRDVVGSDSPIAFEPRPVDDPTVRRPDTTLAVSLLGWEPQVALREGLERTLPWFRSALAAD